MCYLDTNFDVTQDNRVVNYLSILICLLATALVATSQAATPQTGPVIKAFGPVFNVPTGSYNLVPGTPYKISMDISSKGQDPAATNRSLESAARFLNMHARNGIAPKDMQLAVIVHGGAARDLLTDAAYSEQFVQGNPNTALLTALGAAGVPVYLCGQTAGYMGIAPEALHPAVTMALSAMTAHVRLQAEGYTLIPF
ncbi:MAG: intracellular sulfur oxidation DsrE/DsrF family protein [Cyclobacteriaceae bacterium]|jgi:intracellular sulfur oxidation DsrE/DsrF family protein